jgi:hypothetical protein
MPIGVDLAIHGVPKPPAAVDHLNGHVTRNRVDGRVKARA